MPVVKNIKELEKMIAEQMKKKILPATVEYCHKWYASHSEIEEIVSEEKFVQMVKDSMKTKTVNGQFQAEFSIFDKDEIPEDKVDTMKELWEDFKTGFVPNVMKKIFNSKQFIAENNVYESYCCVECA